MYTYVIFFTISVSVVKVGFSWVSSRVSRNAVEEG